LDKLTDAVAEILIAGINELKKNPRPQGCKKLKGREGYRIRKGDYRIICDIYDKILIVEIVTAGHRREIYE
jgi:mRNA interferase RelE/StbE